MNSERFATAINIKYRTMEQRKVFVLGRRIGKGVMKGLLCAAFFTLHSSLLTSCADYNETGNYTAQPDPSFVEPYSDLNPVKSYIDRAAFPNMKLGAMLDVKTFNDQSLAHAAAVTNFDNIAFGKSLMSGSIINSKGYMNFADMKDLLDHVEEIGSEVYGSPIAANSNQPEAWFNLLTAPIEVLVSEIEGDPVDYNAMSTGTFPAESGNASIVRYDNQNVLKINTRAKVRIIDGFEVDPLAKYTVTFWAKADRNATFSVNFSGTDVEGPSGGSFTVVPDGMWKRIAVEARSAEGVTEGYLLITNTRATDLYIRRVEISYLPDNHRPQTAQEVSDTIHYALNEWCDGLMKYNASRIKSFDLIEDAIALNAELDNGMLDLKHSKEKIYWQDIFGSEMYAPTVSKAASAAFERHGGNPADLKFFISETGLEEQKRFESLKYWIGVWDANGAKIDGINAKLNLTYSEDGATQEANKAAFDKLLDNLASTGKLIRLSNFDIKYLDAAGASVAAKDINDAQRQQLADYYAYVIKSYLTKIPKDKQSGICKGNMADTTDPVGLWAVDTKKDWVRTATYKAFCDALSGQ